jgi:hypothetical protein
MQAFYISAEAPVHSLRSGQAWGARNASAISVKVGLEALPPSRAKRSMSLPVADSLARNPAETWNRAHFT